MDWQELGDAISTLRDGIYTQMQATRKATDRVAAGQRILIKSYLDELARQKKDDLDPGLVALVADFPNPLTIGEAYTILQQMLRLWPDHQPGIIACTPDDLDI